jgi:hypothetical protein
MWEVLFFCLLIPKLVARPVAGGDGDDESDDYGDETGLDDDVADA